MSQWLAKILKPEPLRITGRILLADSLQALELSALSLQLRSYLQLRPQSLFLRLEENASMYRWRHVPHKKYYLLATLAFLSWTHFAPALILRCPTLVLSRRDKFPNRDSTAVSQPDKLSALEKN